MLGRIVIGLGSGMAANIIPVYLSETSPTPLRGRILGVQQLMVVLGGLVSYLTGYFLNKSWRLMFALGAIPPIVQAIGMLFLPESPRWLLKYNREEQAMSCFSKIYNLESSEAETELEFEI